jgi:ribosomal protein S18 acetylase RimI-like enzyme
MCEDTARSHLRYRCRSHQQLSQLGRSLLARTNPICVLVSEHNQRRQDFYRRAGYKVQRCDDTIYLKNGE